MAMEDRTPPVRPSKGRRLALVCLARRPLSALHRLDAKARSIETTATPARASVARWNVEQTFRKGV